MSMICGTRVINASLPLKHVNVRLLNQQPRRNHNSDRLSCHNISVPLLLEGSGGAANAAVAQGRCTGSGCYAEEEGGEEEWETHGVQGSQDENES